MALPDVGHSLVSDEATFEAFLAELLRIYRAPYVERLLERVASAPSFVEQARQRRSLRLVALWRACIFQYSESLVHLRQILNDPEEAIHRLGHDRDALVGTPWESWVNGWLEQLRLVSLGRRDQQFDIARPVTATVPAHARVTVVIPAYNHEAFVGDAVRSVLGQSRTDFQVLVVDDASTDRTFEEALAFDDPRVRVIRNRSNLGLGQSVARALEDVGSEFVAILNSDDLFHPERLERCLGRLEEEPQWQLVASALVPIDQDRRVCRVADSSPVFDGEAIHNWLRWFEESAAVSPEPADLFGALLERNFLITSSNLVARTSFLRRHRELWQHLEFCLDWQILLIAAREDALCCVPEGLLGYRLHARNTVWFDSHRRWRYYLESHQVAARALEDLMDGGARAGAEVFSTVLTAISDHLVRNTNIDLPGVILGRSLERLHLRPLQLEAEEVADRLEALDSARHRRLNNEYHFRELGAKPEDLYQMRGEAPYLRSVRNRYEALQGDHEHLRAETSELRERLDRWSAERDTALSSFERRLGDRLVNGLRLRVPLQAAKSAWRALRRAGARAPRMLTQSGSRAGRRKPVAIVAATGRFPIYSHTFVYQELMGLGEMGLNVKLFYWFQESSEKLHEAYAELARNSVKLVSIRDEHLRDMEYWKRTVPGRLEALLARIADSTGRSIAEIESQYDVIQGCTFARAARRFDPAYIHTYFFYEQSLFGMIAAWLLNIPRGITAYADHMLNDYMFKLVPLHLETAAVVVATSHRIKRELMKIGGERFADKILVKSNGVDGVRFAFQSRQEAPDAPFAVISVSRIEPKKGLLTLVDAAHILRKRGRSIVFHIVGTGDPNSPGSVEFAEAFGRRLAESGVEPQFLLHGFKRQNEIIALLGRARAFVAPYVETATGDKDGIPTSLLEAMATGLPSVTTDAGSIPEVIEHGVEGLIVPQNDAVALADALERLMSDPAATADMGRRARARFEREFDARVTEQRLHRRIRDILTEPRPPAPRI